MKNIVKKRHNEHQKAQCQYLDSENERMKNGLKVGKKTIFFNPKD
jgi:hypothetical protein